MNDWANFATPFGLLGVMTTGSQSRPLLEFPGSCGFGENGKPYFWIVTRGQPQTAVHVAFAAPDRAHVDAFHEAALAAGGRDNGEPGLRPYHQHYYGAFVLDPDGNNVEAVCHRP